MLVIAAAIINKSQTEEETTTLLDSLNITDIDFTDELHNIFVRETLIHFDQILRITTIGIWDFHKAQIKKDTAAINLTAKMKAAEIKAATESTNQAIAKATESIQGEQAFTLSSNLRLSNIEKSLKRQEQHTNELYNITKKSRTQKNSSRGQSREHVTSLNINAPQYQTKKNLSNLKIVDLTLDNENNKDEYNSGTVSHYQTQGQRNIKKQRTGQNRGDRNKKTVHWRASKIKTYNPDSPSINHSTAQTGSTTHNLNTIRFCPSQLPTPPPQFHAFSHPFHNPLINSYNFGRLQNLPHSHIQSYSQPLYTPQHGHLTQTNPFTNHQKMGSKGIPSPIPKTTSE
jgi:hypothetical protein